MKQFQPNTTDQPLSTQKEAGIVALKNLPYAIFRGIGQVIFQENALSGACFLLGILCSSLWCGLWALAATLVATLLAYALRYDRERILAGLYGYNACLVGIVVAMLFPCGLMSILLLVAGSACSVVLNRLFERAKGLPLLTAPFVVIAWVLVIVQAKVIDEPLKASPADTVEVVVNHWAAFWKSIGQIMLQGESLLTGMFFIVGIALNSFKQSVSAAVSALFCLPLLCLPFVSVEAFNQGLMGYNAVLTFLALVHVVDVGKNRLLKAFIGILLSVGLQWVGLYYGFPTFTAPFVLSVWVVVFMSRYTDTQ